MIFAGGLGLGPGGGAGGTHLFPGGLQLVRLPTRSVGVTLSSRRLAVAIPARKQLAVVLRRTRLVIQIRDDGDVVVTLM